jgi:hypothetical protein
LSSIAQVAAQTDAAVHAEYCPPAEDSHANAETMVYNDSGARLGIPWGHFRLNLIGRPMYTRVLARIRRNGDTPPGTVHPPRGCGRPDLWGKDSSRLFC